MKKNPDRRPGLGRRRHHAQPLYRRLAARYPGVQIDVYAPAWTRPVHARMPEIHATIDNPFAHGSLRLLQRASEGRRLRVQGYDQAIVLPNSFKSALVRGLPASAPAPAGRAKAAV